MKFTVNLETYQVGEVDPHADWNQLEGVGNNTQHSQLPGHALVEVTVPHVEFRLLHPDTDHSTGHVDIYYAPYRSDNKSGVSIRAYQHGVEIKDFYGDQYRLPQWPTGGWNLFRTIDAVEQHMAEKYGYQPVLCHWIEMNFLTTPWHEMPQQESKATIA
jgi:hypothetical protein